MNWRSDIRISQPRNLNYDLGKRNNHASPSYLDLPIRSDHITDKMPAQVTDIKQFLEIARRKDAKGSISPSRYPEPAPRKHFFSLPAPLVHPDILERKEKGTC